MFLLNSETATSRRLIKLTAYEALLDSNISDLPVDIIRIFKSRNDVLLYNSTLFCEVDGWSRDTYTRIFGEYGTLIYDDEFSKYFAFYNDFNSDSVIRWELISLLALLELDLASTESAIQITCKDGDYTEIFAYYFAAPDAILNEIGVNSAEEIIKSCQIPFNKAHKKSKFLKLSWIDKKTYLDKVLKFNFYDYIQLHKK